MEKLIKWFDLERFGAAIRVIPESPLRGVATTCLEITDQPLYQKHFGFSADMSFEQQTAVANDWAKAMRALDFSLVVERVKDDNNVQIGSRFHSTRSQFSMSELRTLFPDVERADMKEMAVSAIKLDIEHDVALSDEWKAFTIGVLAKDSVGVWTPVENPYAKPFSESVKITEVDPSLERKPFFLFDDNYVSRYYGLPDKLDRAGYRANALIPYYASSEAALADGWEQGEIQQVDMPHVLPLWVTDAGKIIGLRDVRFAPEIMDLSPDAYYKQSETGLIVGAIRESYALGSEFVAAVSQWQSWSDGPESLDWPDKFWGSITQLVSAAGDFKERFPRFRSVIKLLADGEHESRSGSFRAKPLNDMQPNDMRLLVLAARRFVPMADDDAELLEKRLTGLLERVQTKVSDLASAHAKETLRAVRNAVQAPAVVDEAEKHKHVDAGEKIGGARKDFAKRALIREDLDSMNALERETLVTKKNVWAPLNYAAMREDGVTPQAAVCLKFLKDKLNTVPVKKGRNDYFYGEPDFDADYIAAIELVRDAVADVRTVDDFCAAMHKLYDAGRTDSSGRKHDYMYGATAMQIQWGLDVSSIVSNSRDGMLGRDLNYEVRRKVGRYGVDATDDQKWSSLIKPKAAKSEADIEAMRLKRELDRELHCPHLDKVERVGPDWRSGRDITADDLIEHFGFRAVEFGNWLPQDERQQVLNFAFDSFCDLADSLDLPAEEISLGKDLAIAFGSRGTGGKSAALAHFEPSRFVINLTRLKGAGSLAHEWFHALDFHLGKKRDYSSVQNDRLNGSIMSDLTRTMKLRPCTLDEAVTLGTANAEKGQQYAVSWVPFNDREAKQKAAAELKSVYDRVHHAFYEAAKKQLEHDSNIKGRGAVDASHIDSAYAEMVELLKSHQDSKPSKQHRDNMTSCLIHSLNNLARSATAECARDNSIALPADFFGGAYQLPTGFAKEAAKLDKQRSEPYWETTQEMFARAGAAYVYDKLESAGTRSDYLVFGSDESRYAKNPAGNPNPTGADREVIAIQFDKLVADYRVRCAPPAPESSGMEP